MTDSSQSKVDSLEQRLAHLHPLAQALIQDISLDTLVTKIGRMAREQAGADAVVVTLIDDNELVDRQIFTPLNAKSTLQLHDTLPLRFEFMNTIDHEQIAPIAANARALLIVPLMKQTEVQGVIYLLRRYPEPFSTNEEQVVRILADYASVALFNARHYINLNRRDQTLSRRNENLALLNELASTLTVSNNVDEIADNALTQVMDNLHLESGQIYLRQEDGPFLHLAQQRGHLVTDIWEKKTFRVGEGVIGTIAQTGQPRLLNLHHCDRCGLHQSVFDHHIYQLGGFPLTGRRGVLGVLVVATRYPQPLDELEMQFVSSISSWVGTAIENVTLNLQQRRLDILEERERIGMDLHDGVIQSIYAVGLTLEHARLLMAESPERSAPRIEQAIKDLNHTIRDIRAYILDLRPRQLQEENLLQGIQRLVAEFKANTLIEVALEGKSEDFDDLPTGNALALFHICQEALANIAKHAHANKVVITLWAAGERALLEVIDDGHGFDLHNVRLNIGHGLANMNTRASNVGGEVEISSEPDSGTTVMAWVPYPRDPSDLAQKSGDD